MLGESLLRSLSSHSFRSTTAVLQRKATGITRTLCSAGPPATAFARDRSEAATASERFRQALQRTFHSSTQASSESTRTQKATTLLAGNRHHIAGGQHAGMSTQHSDGAGPAVTTTVTSVEQVRFADKITCVPFGTNGSYRRPLS